MFKRDKMLVFKSALLLLILLVSSGVWGQLPVEPGGSTLINRTNNGDIERLQISLYYNSDINGRRIADGIAAKFNNSYSAAVAGEDATKFSNFDEEVAILRNGIKLSIEGRPLIDDADTLPLYMAKMKVQAYEWQFDPSSFNAPGLRARLHDKFTGTQSPISLSSQTVIAFTVTSNTASAVSDRFSVVFSSITDFISNGPVNITSPANWLFYNGSAYVAASEPPSAVYDIKIKQGNTLTINEDFTVGSGKNLALGFSSAMIINPGKVLNIAGSADFNGQQVTIKSTAAGSGSIGQLLSDGTNVTGATNVTVERYISALANRAYRQLGPSVNTLGGVKPYIRDNWQEGTNNPNTSTVNNPVANYGTHITGSKTGENGFDATVTGEPSLYVLSNGGLSWDVIANTNALTMDAKKGYLVFIRGDRSMNLNSNFSNGNTTLRATGSLLLGDQAFNSLSLSKYNFITNPFASAISWKKIFDANSGLGSALVYYDPNRNTRGQYVTVQEDGTVIDGSTSLDMNAINIQTGQAFWVYPNSITSVVVHEADKSGINNRDVYRTNGGTTQRFPVSLYTANANGSRILVDGSVAKFNSNYFEAAGIEDAFKFSNFDEDIAILRGTQKLSIEGRPLIQITDTLPLYMAKMKVKTYEFQFNPSAFDAPGLQAFLQDEFLSEETEISLTGQTIIPFTITSNTASSAAGRFRIVFRTAGVLPVSFTHVKAYQKHGIIQVEWNVATESNIKRYEIERSTDGSLFITKGSVIATANNNSAAAYTWPDATPKHGINYYRIKAIFNTGEIKYSAVVKVNMETDKGSVSLYPNPVKGNAITLRLQSMHQGNYTIVIYNPLGQKVISSTISHPGGSANNLVNLGNLAPGMYQVKITGNNGYTTVLQLNKN